MLQDKIENAINKYENNGSRLEEEFVGSVNGRRYKELAYSFLHKDTLNFEGLSNDEKMEKTLQMRDRASESFQNIGDFKNNYINRRESMRLIEKCQVGNPERPNRFFSRKLYDSVKNRFSEKDFMLKFFTATGGTHLDVMHKIDCFFKLYIRETEAEVACATIDLTQNQNKTTADADILINITDEEKDSYDPSRSNDKFNAGELDLRISEITEQVVEALTEDYRQRNSK